jgi:hypothetical protein
MPQCQFPVFCCFCVSEKLHRKYSRNWTKQKLKFLFFLTRDGFQSRDGGGSEIDSAASAGQKTHIERKLSGRQKSAKEIPSRRGEIIAIIIVIELGFIGIIIIITIITSTFIIFITTPSRYNILG